MIHHGSNEMQESVGTSNRTLYQEHSGNYRTLWERAINPYR